MPHCGDLVFAFLVHFVVVIVVVRARARKYEVIRGRELSYSTIPVVTRGSSVLTCRL